MFAIIKSGGKQYRVEPKAPLAIEKLDGNIGDEVVFDEVLLIGSEENTMVGAPLIQEAFVRAKIVNQTKAKKLVVFKKRRRKGYRRKAGHRQMITNVIVQEISFPGAISADGGGADSDAVETAE
ncbi:50S ribosomal protein L21 [bacterium]|nr:50S ribosomal protein L21 [candidate division CSSED10-310 bacterium]